MNTRPVHIPRPCLALMLAVALGGIAPNLARADSININPSKDNTLYEYVPADGDLSNGLGDHFFAGKTAMGDTPPRCARLRHRGKRSSRLNDHKREP